MAADSNNWQHGPRAAAEPANVRVGINMLQTWLLYSVGCNFGMAGLFVWTMLAGGWNGGIPTFVVVRLCCRLKGAKFVID